MKRLIDWIEVVFTATFVLAFFAALMWIGDRLWPKGRTPQATEVKSEARSR